MKSRIYRGQTVHIRFHPVRRRFNYRLFWIGADLDELEAIHHDVKLLAVDRRGLLSLRTRDRKSPDSESAKDRILSMLAQRGIDGAGLQIMLMTIPRVLGYAFNPVNFYVCTNAKDCIEALVCEVSNTFGEMHHYVAKPDRQEQDCTHFQFPKQFYVSPFIDNHGYYDVATRISGDAFDITISLQQDHRTTLTATLEGQASELTSVRLATSLLRMPLSVSLVMARIHWQAFLLRVHAGLRPQRKPEPSHPNTIPPRKVSMWHRLRHSFIDIARIDARSGQEDTL